MIAYFAGLRKPTLILWCYLAWYIAIIYLYFDPSPRLWLSSVGMSFFIGLALNLATRQLNQTTDGWVVFRLFLIPFCVSSYSAITKGKGFILLFPPSPRDLLICFLACAGIMAVHHACKLFHGLNKNPHTSPGPN